MRPHVPRLWANAVELNLERDFLAGLGAALLDLPQWNEHVTMVDLHGLWAFDESEAPAWIQEFDPADTLLTHGRRGGVSRHQQLDAKQGLDYARVTALERLGEPLCDNTHI